MAYVNINGDAVSILFDKTKVASFATAFTENKLV
jgi:hypothetical protein